MFLEDGIDELVIWRVVFVVTVAKRIGYGLVFMRE